MRFYKTNKGYLLQKISFEWVRLVMQLFICCYFDIVGVPLCKNYMYYTPIIYFHDTLSRFD